MKKVILILTLAVFNAAFLKAQIPLIAPPEKGDYLCLLSNDSTHFNLIFKNSRSVYFDYDIKTKKAGSKSKGSVQMIKDLFEEADKIDFPTIISEDGKKLFEGAEQRRYHYIEARRGTKVYKIVWDGYKEDVITRDFHGLMGSMSSFW
ncbi:MAG: hypothetical protein IAF38_11040 [Bacteroidia bacterium]|nr:hypothetical protein [Bacteroidia bacterium]